jgi:hypothetical protein
MQARVRISPCRDSVKRERQCTRGRGSVLATCSTVRQRGDRPRMRVWATGWCSRYRVPAGPALAPAGSVVSPLGHGIRVLTLFGKPVMTDDTEITVFQSSISGPRQKGHESGDGNCDPHDRHVTSRESRTDSARRSHATARARMFGLAVTPAKIPASELARRRPMYPVWRDRRRRYIDRYGDTRKSWIRSSSHSGVVATSFAADDRPGIGEEASDFRWRSAW